MGGVAEVGVDPTTSDPGTGLERETNPLYPCLTGKMGSDLAKSPRFRVRPALKGGRPAEPTDWVHSSADIVLVASPCG